MSYAQGTRPYTDLVSYIESIVSAKFNANDLIRVNTLINQSIRTLYDRYPFWSRYLQVMEPRAVQRGYLPPTEDAIIVEDAPDALYNGHYLKDGAIWKKTGDPKDQYHFIYESDLYELTMAFGDYDALSFTGAYVTDSSSGDLTNYIWNVVGSGVPTEIRTSNTGTVYQFIHIRYASLSRGNDIVPFVVDHIGAKIIGCGRNRELLYLTYKKPLPNKFGAGVGENANIPAEFFEYAALSAARMFNLSKQINTDPQVRNITLREIEDAAMQQFMIQERNNPDFMQRITHTNL